MDLRLGSRPNLLTAPQGRLRIGQSVGGNGQQRLAPEDRNACDVPVLQYSGVQPSRRQYEFCRIDYDVPPEIHRLQRSGLEIGVLVVHPVFPIRDDRVADLFSDHRRRHPYRPPLHSVYGVHGLAFHDGPGPAVARYEPLGMVDTVVSLECPRLAGVVGLVYLSWSPWTQPLWP